MFFEVWNRLMGFNLGTLKVLKEANGAINLSK